MDELAVKKAAAEAILFASGDALELEVLEQALELSHEEVAALLDGLEQEYAAQYRGFALQRTAQSVQMTTRGELWEYVEGALAPTRRQKLSQAALETLAIIAYNQPVTRAGIEQIRGVNSDHIVRTLTEHGIIEVCGYADTLGHPALYATTDKFLQHFGIQSVADLPPLEALKESAQKEE